MNEKYTPYNTLQLAEDEAFIRWVKDPDGEQASAWQAWLAQHPAKEKEVTEARLLVHSIVFQAKKASTEDKQILWNRIENAISTEQVKPVQKGRVRQLVLRVAAVAAMLTGVFFAWNYFFTDPLTTIVAETASTQAIRLPDGSSVKVNAESELSFLKADWEQERVVSLEGEAFFSVKKGQTFTVKTPNGQVQVLGTSFNVYSRGKTLEVTCHTGKVAVTNHKGDKQVLTPGLRTWTNATGTLQPAAPVSDLAKSDAWRMGQFYFANEPLELVFEELERQFGVKIEASRATKDRPATVYFSNSNLDSALYTVCWPMNLSTERNGNTVVIE